MTKPLRVLLVPLALLHTACPGCPGIGGDDLVIQRKTIAVDACTDEPNINGKGGVTGCTLNFQQTSLSVRVSKEITLTNVGEEDLLITGYSFSLSSDPAFIVEHMPEVIRTGLSSQATVSFRPLLASSVEAELIITTDAENAPDGEIHIHVLGNGVDNGIPIVKIDVVNTEDPMGCCDLGLVAVGSVANCQIRVTNVGDKDLVLEQIGFVPENTRGPWEAVGAMPDPMDSSDDARFTIAAGAFAQVSFKYKPLTVSAAGNPDFAQVEFSTNAPTSCGSAGAFDAMMCNRRDYDVPCSSGTEGKVQVDLRGAGAVPPTCRARIKSVNNSTDFDERLIEPLDEVELTAEDSSTDVGGLTITAYKWTVRGKPPGSNVRMDNDTLVSPRVVFDNSATNIIPGLDVAGDYEFRCEVVDSMGTKSVNDGEAIVRLTATPSEAIHAQLVWDAPEVDVDLHLIREDASGAFVRDGADDCFYGNCKPPQGGGFGDGLIWDAASMPYEGGNPVLDVDDTQGYGPENSNINEPLPGRYNVVVHYFSDDSRGPTVATLRMYLYGNLVAEHQKLFYNHDWWNVGVVEWPAVGGPTWTEINTVDPGL